MTLRFINLPSWAVRDVHDDTELSIVVVHLLASRLAMEEDVVASQISEGRISVPVGTEPERVLEVLHGLEDHFPGVWALNQTQTLIDMKVEDPFSLHEALDRASIIGDLFERTVATHPSIASRPEAAEKVQEITAAFADLYQLLGRQQ